MQVKLICYLFAFSFLFFLTSCSSNKVINGVPTAKPEIKNNIFFTRDGISLPFYSWGPTDNPDKIIIAAHSFRDFSLAYKPIGEFLAKKNISLWTYDQRGFGDSPTLGKWSSGEKMIHDFIDFSQLVIATSRQNTPIILMGESMGAAVIIAALSSYWNVRTPELIILSGPGVRENNPKRYLLNFGLLIANQISPKKSIVLEEAYDNSLSEYHAMRWYKDKRVFNEIRLDSYYGLIKLSDLASNNAKDYGIPSLILYGTNDKQIHKKSICALVKRLGDKSVLKVFENEPHLIFQIKKQESILNLLSKWIDDPNSSGESDFFHFCK